MSDLIIIGAGLAGCEAAWQVAQRGYSVCLCEMRPGLMTGAHTTDQLAELVCSNSLGSNLENRASGLLKNELRLFPSMLLHVADQYALPAGGALAVDRELFSQTITQKICEHPLIHLERIEVTEIPDIPSIIASGPLTSSNLAANISSLTGKENLFFFDAIAPIISEESIDMNIAFRASRYQRGDNEIGDYINCPFSKEEYDHFIEELLTAERIELREFEQQISNGVKSSSSIFFEGCLPIEIIAQRGHNSLAFGPMRPVGIFNPNTGKRPYAVLQLRQENLIGNSYNLVGFQTNLKYSEQKRIFHLIPGLEQAEFIRFGQMHRNTYISSPQFLDPTMQMRSHQHIFLAGQITGVEGYIGNIATGLLAGINAVRYLQGKDLLIFPENTMMGALTHYITSADPKNFQPMKANMGLLPPLENPVKGKKERGFQYANRAISSITEFIENNSISSV